MATKQQLQELAYLRLQEAEVLFVADLCDGCVYLGGYVIELALKACVCARLGVTEYPSDGDQWRQKTFRIHDFEDLSLLAGLESEISLANPVLLQNWSVTTKWRPERRYQPKGTYNRVDAEKILSAIRSKPDGVLEWLSKHW